MHCRQENPDTICQPNATVSECPPKLQSAQNAIRVVHRRSAGNKSTDVASATQARFRRAIHRDRGPDAQAATSDSMKAQKPFAILFFTTQEVGRCSTLRLPLGAQAPGTS
jgi:hypothetical protein